MPPAWLAYVGPLAKLSRLRSGWGDLVLRLSPTRSKRTTTSEHRLRDHDSTISRYSVRLVSLTLAGYRRFGERTKINPGRINQTCVRRVRNVWEHAVRLLRTPIAGCGSGGHPSRRTNRGERRVGASDVALTFVSVSDPTSAVRPSYRTDRLARIVINRYSAIPTVANGTTHTKPPSTVALARLSPVV